MDDRVAPEPEDRGGAAVAVHGGLGAVPFQNIGAGLQRAAGGVGPAALDAEHQDLAVLGLTDAGAGVDRVPGADVLPDAVHKEGGLELHAVRRARAAFRIGVGNIEPVVFMQLDPLVAVAVVVAVGHAAAHCKAGDLPAVAHAALVDEAGAGHGKHAAVGLGDLAHDLTVVGQGRRRAEAEAGRVLGDSQNRAGGRAAAAVLCVDLHDQNAVRGVDGQNLLAELRADRGALIAQSGVVNQDIGVAVRYSFGVLRQIGLAGVAVQLIEQGVEALLLVSQRVEAGVLFLDLLDDLVLEVGHGEDVFGGLFVLGRGVVTDLGELRGVHLFAFGVGDPGQEQVHQTLVPHRGVGGLDPEGPEIGDLAQIGVIRRDIEGQADQKGDHGPLPVAVERQQDDQDDRQGRQYKQKDPLGPGSEIKEIEPGEDQTEIEVNRKNQTHQNDGEDPLDRRRKLFASVAGAARRAAGIVAGSLRIISHAAASFW